MIFTTSTKTRPLIVAKLEEYIRNKLVKPKSQRLISETKTFIWNNGKPQAMRSYHDDLIMSLAMLVGFETQLLKYQRKKCYIRKLWSIHVFNRQNYQHSNPGMRI